MPARRQQRRRCGVPAETGHGVIDAVSARRSVAGRGRYQGSCEVEPAAGSQCGTGPGRGINRPGTAISATAGGCDVRPRPIGRGGRWWNMPRHRHGGAVRLRSASTPGSSAAAPRLMFGSSGSSAVVVEGMAA